jgi:fructose-specific component phosphotransferase system IIB-like protein
MNLTVTIGRVIDGVPVTMPSVSETHSDIAPVFMQDIDVPDASANLEVNLAAIANSQAKYLIITASQYDATLTVRFGAAINTEYPLTGAWIMSMPVFQVLTEVGATETVDKIFLTNGIGSDVTVRVEEYFDPTP